jgi:hypothetical protein
MILNFKTSMHIPDVSCSILTHEYPLDAVPQLIVGNI